jgi:hypothetical protein
MHGRRGPHVTVLAFINLQTRVPPSHALQRSRRSRAGLSSAYSTPLTVAGWGKQPASLGQIHWSKAP